jgi:hypothetical protein
MPIVNMSHDRNNIPSDAVNVRGQCHVINRNCSPEVIGPSIYWLYDTFVGKCLFEREQNGAWDSDFYMTVWNDEKGCPESLLFASTRGWSYPCYASRVDATPEVQAKYNAWCEEQRIKAAKAQRSAKARKLVKLRRDMIDTAKTWNVSYTKLLKLRKMQGFDGIFSLFNVRLRSNFKLSMRNQVIDWLNGKSKYATPLSKKQIDCLTGSN